MWLIIGEPMDHWSCGEWLMEDMADYEEVVAHGRYGGLRRGGGSWKIMLLIEDLFIVLETWWLFGNTRLLVGDSLVDWF